MKITKRRKDRAHRQADRIEALIRKLDLDALPPAEGHDVLNDIRIACDDAAQDADERAGRKN